MTTKFGVKKLKILSLSCGEKHTSIS